jgi:GGDEF domain-containing protein
LEGDSYALLLPGCVAAVAAQLGARLRQELAGLGIGHQGLRLSVGATVGVAEADSRTLESAGAWLARAQAAWYEAKYGGQGAVRLAAPAASVALVLPA